jgi:predicted nucleic acid-binding protein
VIVADVHLVAYLLLGGPDAAAARAVFTRDPVWATPVLWRSEFRSILAAYLRQRALPLDVAWEAYELAESLLAAHEAHPPSERVLRLIAASDCSAYDCEYVALAAELAVPLVTADRAVLRAFPHIAQSPTRFCT